MPSPWASILCLDPQPQGWGAALASTQGSPGAGGASPPGPFPTQRAGAQVTALARSPGGLDTHVAEGQI